MEGRESYGHTALGHAKSNKRAIREDMTGTRPVVEDVVVGRLGAETEASDDVQQSGQLSERERLAREEYEALSWRRWDVRER